MASSSTSIPHRLEAPAPPRQLPPLTDELLEEIFLRIDSPADLVRTSICCVSFRRLIAGRYFLRRYRSLHRPLFLGFVHLKGFEPTQAPLTSAPVARALARAADFSFGDLPPGRWPAGWHPCDARDGLVLLKCSPRGSFQLMCRVDLMDLAVCDPLSQRHVLLPPIPDDLVASVQVQQQNLHVRDAEAFLASSGDEEETTFRVIGLAHCISGLVMFVFSSDSGQWSAAASTSWDALKLMSAQVHLSGRRYSVCVCFFWKFDFMNKLLMLDMNKMEFSTVDLPPDLAEKSIAIVEAGEGRLGMFSGIGDNSSESPVHYFIRRTKGDGAQEWQMEHVVQMPMYDDCSTIGVVEGYVLLYCVPRPLAPVRGIQYSLIDVKTLKFERVSGIIRRYCLYPYLGFPPSISPIRI